MTRPLHNIYSREDLEKKRAQEDFARKALSFYRYQNIPSPILTRNELYKSWEDLGVLGRVYVASEGINAQLSVPEPSWQAFMDVLQKFEITRDIFINEALTEGQDAFLKLDVKVREKIVADGLTEDVFSKAQGGQHLDPLSFHEKLQQDDVLLVDTRNDYECEIGHFEGALLPESTNFRDVLPELTDKLSSHKDKEILMYCTGGIRCEKASAYFQSKGFEHVYQLQGGIINYMHTVRNQDVSSKFHGSNFVFDGRMAEKVDDEIAGSCITCQKPYFKHVDCANQRCHKLVVQCDACAQEFHGCCSKNCQDVLQAQQPAA